VFKDPLSRFEQREGLWGGYLPVVSLQFKIADHGGGPGHCSATPRPCPPSHGDGEAIQTPLSTFYMKNH
jgi:hypothetical protein